MGQARLERNLHGVHVVLTCADGAEEQGEWVMEVLAKLPAGGLIPGRTLRFGWSSIRLEPRGDALVVTEPDFDGDPLNAWRDDVTVTLQVQGSMLGTAEGVDAEPRFPRFTDTVTAVPGWEKSARVALARSLEFGAGDSGWLIIPPGAVSNVPPEQFPVFELLRRRSELLSAMALPGGWVVEFEEDEILGYGKPG